MKNHIKSIVSKLNKIVSPKDCKKMALITGFVKRSTSRLDGYELVKTLIVSSGDDSLHVYRRRIKEYNHKAELSAPGLAQRINQLSAVKLMRHVFVKCLTNLYEKNAPTLNGIERILLQDSTCIPLNKALADTYSGCGGHHENAGLKFDCIYDYTSEAILNIHHHSRTTPYCNGGDQIYNYIKPNDLIISDLGYFKFERFKKIDDDGAFFVSKLKVGTLVYKSENDPEPISLIKLLKKKLNNNSFLDTTIYIGSKKMKVRLIVKKLPDEVINVRLRKANRDAQVRRTQLSEEKKMLLSYIIIITNLPCDIASTNDVLMLYRIRWRIELVFKEWKSQIKIGNITGTNVHRIECLILARMCLLLILNKLTSYLSNLYLSLHNEELSIKKVLDYFTKDGNLVQLFSKGGFTKIVKGTEKELFHLKKSKRIKRKTTLKILMESNLWNELKLA